jgi:hypothetical protein
MPEQTEPAVDLTASELADRRQARWSEFLRQHRWAQTERALLETGP